MAKANKASVIPSSILDAVVPIVDESPRREVTAESPVDRPKLPTDPDWTDYVISQLEEGEVWKEEKVGKTTYFPTVLGLRRFVDSNFELVSSTSHSTSTLSNGPGVMPTVTVEHHIIVSKREGFPREVSGVGCAGPHNLAKDFCYPGECAETRAEARAYIRLLRLKVCSKEEIANPTGFVVRDKISSVQLKQLETMCKTLNVNVMKFVNAGSAGAIYKSPEEFPEGKFALAVAFLNKYQQDLHNKKVSDDDKAFIQRIGGYVAAEVS